jgi:hypothetical protein
MKFFSVFFLQIKIMDDESIGQAYILYIFYLSFRC